jgi:predicted Zn-dependent protease
MTGAASHPLPTAPSAAAPASRLRRFAARLRGPRAVLALCILLLLIAEGFFAARRLVFDHHFRAAREALDEQDCDEARPHLDACLRLRPACAEVHLVAARGLRRAGFSDDAEQQLRDYERVEGQGPATVLEWALLGASRGDLPTNEPFLLARLDEGGPQAGQILEALAQGSIDTYSLGRARHYLDLLLKREPDNALGLMWLGWLYEARGGFDDAVESYRHALRVHPRQPAVRLRLAQFALQHGDLAEAEGHLDNLRRRGYRRSEVLLTLARCRMKRGDEDEARRLLDELLAGSPNDSVALFERGKLALQDNDPAAAERFLRRAVEIEPHSRQSLNYLVQALAQQGNAHEAEEFRSRLKKTEDEMKRMEEIFKSISAAPNDVRLRREAAVICLRNGQDAEALRWLTGALQIDPSYAPARETLAEYYERAGQPDLAARERRLAASGKR